MSTYDISLFLLKIRNIAAIFIDIFIIWLAIYYTLRIVRSNSKSLQIFKGIVLVILVDAIAKILGLKTIQFLTDIFINWGFLAIIIIFQPEIRSLLEKLGKTNFFSRMGALSGNEKEELVNRIVTAVMLLSADQTGALISIEQGQSLDNFVATGTKLNSDVTAELLTSIFVTSTPLHDGAVIIQGDKIACASAYFPPTNMELPSRYGSRHRAAIGISEISDAITIVISEETGIVSVTENGGITQVNRTQLRNYLLNAIGGEQSSQQLPQPVLPKQEEKKENFLSKLVVKKQEPSKQEKIAVEEVIVQPQSRSLEQIHHDADSVAQKAGMKIPHKRQRPVPSYPTQSRVRQATNQTQRVIIDREQNELYDTTKLDISKIVGFHDELEEQFQMVDALPETKKEGENHE